MTINADYVPIVGISAEDLPFWGDGNVTTGAEKDGGLQNTTLDFNHTAAHEGTEILESTAFYSPAQFEIGYKLPHFPEALGLDIMPFQYDPVMYSPV